MTDINNDVPVNTEDEGSTNTETSAVDTSPTETTEASKAKPTFKEVIGSAFDELKAKKEQEAAEPKAGQRKVATTPTNPVAKPAVVEQQEVDPLTGAPLQPLKPPNSMPASLREKWKAVPREFQKYWNDRELDMAQNYTKLGNDAKFAKEIHGYIAPMSTLIKNANTTPEAYAKSVFEASNTLNHGSAQERAAVLAQMIKTFQPDKATLQALLSGQPVNIQKAPPPPVNIDVEVEKRLAERSQTQAQTQANDVIQSFIADPVNEFAQDVETQMASAISGGFIPTEGKSMPEILKAAYDFACSNHPEIRAILTSRGQPAGQVAAKPNTKVVKPIRSAQPSLGGGLHSGKPSKKYKSAKEAAADAYDELMNSR